MIVGRIELGDRGPRYTPIERDLARDGRPHRRSLRAARDRHRAVVVVAPRLYTDRADPWVELNGAVDTIVARHGRHRFVARSRLVDAARTGSGCTRPILVPDSVVRLHAARQATTARSARRLERSLARARFRIPTKGCRRRSVAVIGAAVAIGLLSLSIVDARSTRNAGTDAQRIAATAAQTVIRDQEQRREREAGLRGEIALMERHISVPYIGLLAAIVATIGEDDRIVRFTAGNGEFTLVARVASPAGIARLDTIDLVSGIRYSTRVTPDATIVDVGGRVASDRADGARIEPPRGSADSPADARGTEPGGIEALVERRDALLVSFAPPEASASDLAEALGERARAHGATVRAIGVDVGSRRTEIAVSDAPARVMGWLFDAEPTVMRAGAQIERVAVASDSTGSIVATLAAVYVGATGAASVAARSLPTRSEVDARSGRWVRASADAVARALSVPTGTPTVRVDPGDAQPEEEATAGLPHAAAPLRTTLPRYIGRVGGDIEAYAFRFPESSLVRTIAVGQAAFGWRLRETTGTQFVFEKEGYAYETNR